MSQNELKPSGRRSVLILALAFEGGLLAFAMLLGWMLGYYPHQELKWDVRDFWLGIVATIPMLFFFALHFREPIGSMTGMRDVSDNLIRPLFSSCTLLDFLWIAALAGLSEEMLFRAVIQKSLTEGLGDPLWGLLLGSLLFGLAHAITLQYVFFAAIVGAWLGWLYQQTGSLLLVSVTHGAYDFIALIVLVRLVKPEEKPISITNEEPSETLAEKEPKSMKGSDKVIEALNRALTIELTAINQYFCQAKMCENWGLYHLYRKHYHESMGEMKHAEKIIERILFLEGNPEIGRYDPIHVGVDVKEQFENDLKLETSGVHHYNATVQLCRDEGDNGTRELIAPILVESEEHVDWLEAQLGLIEMMGIENYLAEQMGAGEESE